MRFSSGSYQLDLKFDKLDPFTSLKKMKRKESNPAHCSEVNQLLQLIDFNCFQLLSGSLYITGDVINGPFGSN